jgi:hypothetical protein
VHSSGATVDHEVMLSAEVCRRHCAALVPEAMAGEVELSPTASVGRNEALDLDRLNRMAA